VIIEILLLLCSDDDDTLQPVDNYGPEGTWFHLVCDDKINFEGDSDNLVIGGIPKNNCYSIRSYRDCSDMRSVRLYDKFNPNSFLPEGMVIKLF
jgi:hypothetical protein